MRERSRARKRAPRPAISEKTEIAAAAPETAAAAPEIAAAAPASAPVAVVEPPQRKPGNATIRIRAKLGAAFRIVKVTTLIDGRAVSTSDGKRLEQVHEVEAFSGAIAPGKHSLLVLAEYRGDGHSVFSYFDGYRYSARSSTELSVPEGGRTEVTVDLLDKGGANTAFEERLAIAFATK